MEALLRECRLCPRECGVDRIAGERGICGASDQIILARAALHFWEEPVISGKNGSGAVFFSGCRLGCVYCQNAEISSGKKGDLCGRAVTTEQLTRIFLRLQDREGANNISRALPSSGVGGDQAGERKGTEDSRDLQQQRV